ncbi:hypothetical protein HJC23_012312 [Cyclotella cryptica]|uniref:Rhodanese domain-containing protein n=1 Tax=Cyclotella cryptica TaxID=29204 RepID=A0ABD3PLS9_9STRA|eukprot:CCRYP_013499-RA/>CCRYP_013499-RA protein AED:0.02 eAED:0.02 QI:0/-1/0/1/-1/1/1/0/336
MTTHHFAAHVTSTLSPACHQQRFDLFRHVPLLANCHTGIIGCVSSYERVIINSPIVNQRAMSEQERSANTATATAAATSQKYHKMFPDVESLSSEKLLHDTFSTSTESSCADDIKASKWIIDGKNAVLVDVRSRPERNTSMISGAISLDEFKTNVIPQLMELSPDDVLSQPNTIVFYCTIGYRSGVEARKMQNEYPFLFHQECKAEHYGKSETHNLKKKQQSKIQVRNLDGILNFANALEASETQARMNVASTNEPNKHITKGLLINPNTNQPTNRVHVYGPSWKHCLSESYDPVVFSNMEFGWRGLGVLLQRISCIGCSCGCEQACRRYPWSKSD